MDLKSLIRDIPDFPKPGIVFRDITTLLGDPAGLRYAIDCLADNFTAAGLNAEYVVGVESRGFIIGAPLAYKLGFGFVPVRKAGKLPALVYSIEYQLEYGTDRLEVHQDALQPGSKVLIVDDLLATAATMPKGMAIAQVTIKDAIASSSVAHIRSHNSDATER